LQFKVSLLWENIQRWCNAEGTYAQEETQETAPQQFRLQTLLYCQLFGLYAIIDLI